MAEAKTAVRKIVRKKWCSIVAPALFSNAILGDCLVAEKKDVVGRKFAVNLMNLTGDARKQNINVRFAVTGLKDDVAQTEVVGYEVSSASIKRSVRRYSSRVDDSFVCETSDGVSVRIKPLLITKAKTGRRTLTHLRKFAVDSLKSGIKGIGYAELVEGVLSNKIQVTMKKDLNKIFPLRFIDIRRFDVVGKK